MKKSQKTLVDEAIEKDLKNIGKIMNDGNIQLFELPFGTRPDFPAFCEKVKKWWAEYYEVEVFEVKRESLHSYTVRCSYSSKLDEVFDMCINTDKLAELEYIELEMGVGDGKDFCKSQFYKWRPLNEDENTFIEKMKELFKEWNKKENLTLGEAWKDIREKTDYDKYSRRQRVKFSELIEQMAHAYEEGIIKL